MSDVQQAELSVLGAVLLSGGKALDELDLSPADFFSPQHETVFRVMLDMKKAGTPIDAVTIVPELAACDVKVNPMVLHQAMEATPTAANADYYAGIISTEATRRRIKAAAARINQLANEPGDIDALVEAARAEVDNTSRKAGSRVLAFGETIDLMLQGLGEDIEHVPTPWAALNDIIGGLRPGALYVVGARPSVGKSVVALMLAKALTHAGSVAFSSLEMSQADVQIRAVAQDLHIDLRRLLERDLTPGDWNKIRERRPAWSGVPLFIDDRSGVTITDIKRFARSVDRRRPLAGLVVDYLQLMNQPHGDKRPRHEFVADMSRQLKILAMDMHIPVIALSQLNRASEQRQDKMPQLSDLRESGAVEQDSDVVILLHREIMGEKRNDMHMLVAKNRHGATNVAQMQFWGHYSEIRD